MPVCVCHFPNVFRTKHIIKIKTVIKHKKYAVNKKHKIVFYIFAKEYLGCPPKSAPDG